MSAKSKGRQSVAMFVSIGIHVALVVALISIPENVKTSLDTVDITVIKNKPKVEPPIIDSSQLPEPIPEEILKIKKQKKIKIKRKIKSPPSPLPDEKQTEPQDEQKKEAPPVFDLGDNTFAADGQKANWSLNRSEGNTKFARVANPNQKSVRETKPKSNSDGKPGGTGDTIVPLKDLSKRPKVKDGNVKIPPYPPEARREGIEGKVILQVVINKYGKVVKIRIVKEPGFGLGETAKKAMLKEQWEPAINKDGKAVMTVIVYTYRFTLED